MNDKPYIALFKKAPLNNEITLFFEKEKQFTRHFDENKNLRWGVLIDRDKGSRVIEVGRPDNHIVLPEKPVTKGIHVDRIQTENTSGNCMVDFVRLKSGKVLAYRNR